MRRGTTRVDHRMTIFLLAAATLAAGPAWAEDGATPSRIREAYHQLPLSFEENRGQSASEVKFLARGSGFTAFFTPREVVFSLPQPVATEHRKPGVRGSFPSRKVRGPSSVIRMSFSGSNASPQISGTEAFPGTSNYFIGNDPAAWQTDVPQFVKVRYRDVYPGVDVVFYGGQRRLEYDLIVSPGGDPNAIRVVFEGTAELELDDEDGLILHTPGGDLRFHLPIIYQESKGVRRSIEGCYTRLGEHEVGFRVGGYDADKPLVIDPALSYSTYLGGAAQDRALGIALDSSGNSYVTGITNSTNFPSTGGYQGANGGLDDIFVTKLSTNGAIVYSTYLGGSGFDDGLAIAVDGAGNAYVTGATTSGNFPIKNAAQAFYGGGQDAFVAKIGSTGNTLVYSTYLGGSGQDTAFGVAVDSAGAAYVTGGTLSSNFPTRNPIQASNGGPNFSDVFVTKVDPTGSSLVYSTYLGGTGSFDDQGFGIKVDGAGNAYIVGLTSSPNFPTRNPIQPTYGGNQDAFVLKINPSGTGLVYSTFLGGSGQDGAVDIALDAQGNAYVTGLTRSTNFPTQNAYQSTNRGGADVFVTKINPGGTGLVYSTYLGGTDGESGTGIALDASGNAYVAGTVVSVDFPTQSPLQPPKGSVSDAFVSELSASGSALLFSTYLGGSGENDGRTIAVDAIGNVYVTGWTTSTDFPTLSAAQGSYAGGLDDAFVTKISFGGGSPGSCQPNANTLCLSGDRYRVTTAWRSPSASGSGTAVALTGDTGYFWFFISSNVEVITKVLKACANPFNSYWVFAAGLTNVEVTLTVTDTRTGVVRTYFNPEGTAFAPIQDTTAFATCP